MILNVLKYLTPALIFLSSYAVADELSCKSQNHNKSDKLLDCLELNNLVSHLKSFQAFATDNKELPGTRFTATEGAELSKDYIAKTLQAAGYQVSLQNVPVDIAFIKPQRTFEQVSPAKKSYEDNTDYMPLINSGGGDITGQVEAPAGDSHGCAMKDFSGFTKGHIALVQWAGNCTRRDSVMNAVAAGAKAVILYDAYYGVMSLGMKSPLPSETTPILVASDKIAKDLKRGIATGELPVVHIQFDMQRKTQMATNIIADSPTGNPNHIVMVGAHYDSAAANAGINDNASAVATILETALLMQHTKTTNKLRFAFWAGEELDLLGSNYYVEQLSEAEKNNITVYLNYEIMGAANGARLIMGHAKGVTPAGTEKVTQMYVDYFTSQNQKYFVFDPTISDAAKRSDLLAFINANIPVGYMMSGASVPWHPVLNGIFTDLPKRKNGVAMHPCYHKACDNLTMRNAELTDPNFDFALYLQMLKAAAYGIYHYAQAMN